MAGKWATTTPTETITRPFKEQIPEIQQVVLYLERKGKAKGTIDVMRKALVGLAERANLNKPQDIELAISRYKLKNNLTNQITNKPATNRWKAQLCTAYMHYCKTQGITWEMPTYRIDEKGIQPPTPEKCQMLMAAAHGLLSLKIDISTQTGLRPIEIQGDKGLKVRDIHPDQRTITATSTKGCNPRPPMQISEQLLARLQTYITRYKLQAEDTLFTGKARNYGDHFRRFKKRLSKELADPSIEAIRLYDIRHTYITGKLRKIQNAEIVRQIVGHKRLNTTQKYFHLLASQSGEWITEQTNDRKRADELIKADYTYVLTTPDGYMQFKKAK